MSKKVKNFNLEEELVRNQEEVKQWVTRYLLEHPEHSCNVCCGSIALEKIIEYVEENNINQIQITNIDTFVKGVGSTACVICVINRLRNNGISIYFKEEGFSTFNRDVDLQLGAIIEQCWKQFLSEILDSVEKGKIKNRKKK